MYDLPTSINIDDRVFNIRSRGDFRVVFDCLSALNDVELDERYRIVTALIIFYDGLTFDNFSTFFEYNEENITKAAEEMFRFFECGQKSVGAMTNCKLIDWEQDSHIIFAAVNNVAHMEVRAEPYLHWWTFMGYYCSIGESVLSNVVGIRNKIMKGKKLEKYEQEFRRDNPQYFTWNSKTTLQIAEEQEILKLWNGGES